jgi:predicted nucleic acid-binding protein
VIVVSDTNILSSFAAGDSLPALLHLFARSTLCIPPSVQDELQVGLDKGRNYLEPIFRAITAHQIEILSLSSDEEQSLQSYPQRLNLGERQAIALAQTRNAVLLSNDKRALRYCQQQHLRTVDLVGILRLLWVRQIMSQDEVRTLMTKMEQVENLVLTPAQQQAIFAPPRRK